MRQTQLAARVRRRVPVLAAEMVATFVADVPFYARLPQEQLDGEITAICADSLLAVLAAVQEQRGPTEAELETNRLSAIRRVHEAVPLEALLAAYLIGGRLAWRELVAQARPDETPELLTAADVLQLYIQRVTGVVTQTYLGEQQLIAGAQQDVRRDLARALLAGVDADDLAARAGIDVLRRWTLLALRLGSHPDEGRRDTDAVVASRRKLRRLHDVLDGLPGPVLPLLDTHGGVVLVPHDVDDGLVEQLRAAVGTSVHLGIATAATPADVPAAGKLAEELAGLATGVPARLETHALAYQLSRPSAALAQLTGVLAPLDDKPDLLETLRVFLAANLDRRAAAAVLHVHPNTLDYRLRRIAALTGHACSDVTGLMALAAALEARRAW
ncbi:MAG: hypothetical protein JWO12_573 [Frankiales bacterium]|nr:hypothetical protein [Frankiales bacterium]